MMKMATKCKHIPVLLNECINLLNIKPNGIYIDATAGMGGHAAAILSHLDNGQLICIDCDNFAIETLKNKFATNKNVKVIKSNFSDIDNKLKKESIKYVDGILADLGVSSPMFDIANRGFSYKLDARLDMRMDQDQKLDAWIIVNKYSYDRLVELFSKYGEAKEARKVAKAICYYRDNKSIDTTNQLVGIIKSAISINTIYKKKHPARVYFQALRIAVNDELNKLAKFIKSACDSLSYHGRLAIISYHSLEDRIIKNEFNRLTTSFIPVEVPIIDQEVKYSLVNKHPIIPSKQEIIDNNRARSAKLRVIMCDDKTRGVAHV